MKLSDIPRILLILFPSILILGFVVLLTFFTSHNIHDLVQDIATTAKVHPMVGILNNLGIILWTSSAAVCFFSALTLRRNLSGRFHAFFLSSGLLSAYLLLDDMFLFHEFIAPINMGIDQNVIFLVLLVAVFAYLTAFYNLILKTNYVYLLISGAFLAGSLFVDVFLYESLQEKIGLWEHFIEDSFKWLGIVFWFTYFADTAYHSFIGPVPDKK